MKVLVIRFSSIGDVTQALSIPGHIHRFFPEAEIHILTKESFKELFANHYAVSKVWSIGPKEGVKDLWPLAKKLRKEKFTHLYDAHNNLRSNFFYFFVSAQKKLQRPMMRWKRFLLLKFKINLFEKPLSGQRDLLKPLESWGLPFTFPDSLPLAPQLFLSAEYKKKAEQILESHHLKNYVVLIPSAAHALKRWPMTHWEKLVELNPQQKFLILAGPGDDFTQSLNHFSNVINLTGQTSLMESAALIEKALATVTNDTGLLHFSEQLGIPAIALMGPAPFGFPSRPTTQILERNLKCRPCSKHGQGPCVNANYHECLVSISPEEVSRTLANMLSMNFNTGSIK